MSSIREHLCQIKQQQETPRPIDPPQPDVQPSPCPITAKFMKEFKADLARYTASLFAILDTVAWSPVTRHRRHCASTRSCSNTPMIQPHSCQTLDSLPPMPIIPQCHIPYKQPRSSNDPLPPPKLQHLEIQQPTMHPGHSIPRDI